MSGCLFYSSKMFKKKIRTSHKSNKLTEANLSWHLPSPLAYLRAITKPQSNSGHLCSFNRVRCCQSARLSAMLSFEKLHCNFGLSFRSHLARIIERFKCVIEVHNSLRVDGRSLKKSTATLWGTFLSPLLSAIMMVYLNYQNARLKQLCTELYKQKSKLAKVIIRRR